MGLENVLTTQSLKCVVVLAICGAILLYSGLNGFESTVFTDTIQGIIVVVLCLVVVGTILFKAPITASNIHEQSVELLGWRIFTGSLALNISLFWTVLLDFTFWQRMFCVDRQTAAKASAFGLVLICLTLILLGSIGLFLKTSCSVDSYNVVFLTIGEYGIGWIVICLILLVTLVTSTVDSLLFACLSIVSAQIVGRHTISKVILDDFPPTESSDISDDKMAERSTADAKCHSLAPEIPDATKSCLSFFRHKPRVCTNIILFIGIVSIGGMACIISSYNATNSLANVFFLCGILTSSLIFPLFAGLFLPIYRYWCLWWSD